MVTVIVRGEPQPQGNKTGFVVPGKGTAKPRAVVVEGRRGPARQKFADWREAVRHEAQHTMDGRPPLEGPLVASLVFTVPKPASAPKTRVTYPAKRPDLDKLARAVMDGLTAAGVYKDDSQIIGFIRLWKQYPLEFDHWSLREMVGPALITTESHVDGLSSPGVVIRIRNV